MPLGVTPNFTLGPSGEIIPLGSPTPTRSPWA